MNYNGVIIGGHWKVSFPRSYHILWISNVNLLYLDYIVHRFLVLMGVIVVNGIDAIRLSPT